MKLSLVDVRAYSHLLATDYEFLERVPISTELLAKVKSVRWPMSKLALSQMATTYFINFGTIKGSEEKNLLSFIDDALSSVRLNEGSGFLNQVHSNRHWLLSQSGPAEVAARARASNADLESYLFTIGLGSLLQSAYVLNCRTSYYLKTLEDSRG